MPRVKTRKPIPIVTPCPKPKSFYQHHTALTMSAVIPVETPSELAKGPRFDAAMFHLIQNVLLTDTNDEETMSLFTEGGVLELIDFLSLSNHDWTGINATIAQVHTFRAICEWVHVHSGNDFPNVTDALMNLDYATLRASRLNGSKCNNLSCCCSLRQNRWTTIKHKVFDLHINHVINHVLCRPVLFSVPFRKAGIYHLEDFRSMTFSEWKNLCWKNADGTTHYMRISHVHLVHSINEWLDDKANRELHGGDSCAILFLTKDMLRKYRLSKYKPDRQPRN